MDIVNSGIYIEDEKLGTYALSAAKLLPIAGSQTGAFAGSISARIIPVVTALRSPTVDGRRRSFPPRNSHSTAVITLTAIRRRAFAP